MYLEVNEELSYLDSLSLANTLSFYAENFAGTEIKSLGFNDDNGYAFIQLHSNLFNYFLSIRSAYNNNANIILTHAETGETLIFDSFKEYKNFITKERENNE
jgi:hypothetical protein